MGERSKVAVVVAVLALAAVACGSRVVPLSQDLTGQPIPGVDPSTGLPVNPTAPGVVNPTVGPSVPGGPGPVIPGVPGAKPCKATKASDTGVTATTIKLGLIASLTGPFPGQFDSSVQATDSYFRMINDLGGICGRRVQLLVRDDNGNGQTNLTVASRLAEEDKVFSFVGSVSAPDDSGIPKVSKKYKMPDIGFPLTWERAESQYTFGVPGQLQKRTIGEGASGIPYLNKTLGVTQMAIFWLRESEVSILNAWGFEATALKLAERNGHPMRICYERPAGVVDSNYDSYVVSMEEACDPANGPIGVYTTMENNANIKLAQAMKRQGFKPRVFAPTFSSYLPEFISQAGGTTEGAYIAMPQIPFERLERPQSEWTPGTHELKRYMETLRRYYPRAKSPGSFGGAGWGMAAMFTQAAVTCGDDLTRACLQKTLETMGPFSANGFLSPNKPGLHAIYTADLLVQVRGGKFVEVRPTDKSGPKEAPDFWDDSVLYDWWNYYCANRETGKFPNTADKNRYIRC